MAVDLDSENPKRKRKSSRNLLLHDQVEVRSVEDGFQGSWHSATIIACENHVLNVKYDHFPRDDGSENLVDVVAVSPPIDGCYRGCIRPLPPSLDFDKRCLHYGLCVDVLYNDAWWEGVIFDHEDGLEERRIFFPDMGDELKIGIDKLRITQDWNEVMENWECRGNWIFLELIEEYKQEKPLIVFVKDIWYTLREKNGFRKVKEWTSSKKDLWKELLLEAIDDFELPNPVLDVALEPKANLNNCLLDSVLTIDDEISCISSNTDSEGYSSISSSKFNGKRKPACLTHRGKSNWQPAGLDIVPGAEFCPGAITEYARASLSNGNAQNSLTTKVRKHLSYLGWKIEFVKDKSIRRMRYTSPEGKNYLSLRKVCQVLGEPTENLSPISLDEQRSLHTLPDDMSSSSLIKQPQVREEAIEVHCHSDVVVVEPEYCPQAVVDWYMLGEKKSCSENKSRVMSLKARKHLSAVGWVFWFANKKGRRELRYNSPKGRCYYSLRTACKGCMDEGGVFEGNASTCRPMKSKDMNEEAEVHLACDKLSSAKINMEFEGGLVPHNRKTGLLHLASPSLQSQTQADLHVRQDGFAVGLIGSRKRRAPK